MAPATKLLYLCRTCKNSAEASAVVVSWVLGRGHAVDEQEAWEVVTSVGHMCFVHRKQTCALPSCGEIYTPETTNQRYCSDKCCTEAKTGPVPPDPRIAVWERTRAYLRSLYQ